MSWRTAVNNLEQEGTPRPIAWATRCTSGAQYAAVGPHSTDGGRSRGSHHHQTEQPQRRRPRRCRCDSDPPFLPFPLESALSPARHHQMKQPHRRRPRRFAPSRATQRQLAPTPPSPWPTLTSHGRSEPDVAGTGRGQPSPATRGTSLYVARPTAGVQSFGPGQCGVAEASPGPPLLGHRRPLAPMNLDLSM